jgi:hypothetical protein
MASTVIDGLVLLIDDEAPTRYTSLGKAAA